MDTLTLRSFTTRIADDNAFRQRVARSLSPGGAADQLGVSRQRVHQLLNAGLLDGLKVMSEDGPAIVLVFTESVERRLEKRRA